MIDSAVLLADLKRELKTLEADLRVRADDESSAWGGRLRDEYQRAQARERTGLAWIDWRDGQVAQAAVAWIIATVFIRFGEDNGLLTGATKDGRPVAQPWIAAPGDGLERAVENEAAFYAAAPTMTSRDWLQEAFGVLADLPAGATLVDRDHSAVWHAEISAAASDGLLAFFRRTTPDGSLVHDFSDPDLGTRFLGDLYQDLSDHAKKTYALLQTPEFVEQFILDLTLTPAITEFGLTGLKLIDPACGSGHFLLGAFDRLMNEWARTAPGLDKGDRAQRALHSIHGVDLNPFAIAIARFRLTIAAIRAAGISTLVAAPAFRYHLAIGDSLLGGSNVAGGLEGVPVPLELADGDGFEYGVEDLREFAGILSPGQYHVVVANPPYITVKDAVLNQRYRGVFNYCIGAYALSVPFMEVLFRLAKPPVGGAGYVGQITSNSFMTRDFGKPLVETFLAGRDLSVPVDLTYVVDTSDVRLAGHGTPTVILIGRRQRPVGPNLRAALSVTGDGSTDQNSESGPLWRGIVEHINSDYESPYVSISLADRERFATHPWSLSGGRAGELKHTLDGHGTALRTFVELVGRTSHTGLDDAFLRPVAYPKRHRIAEVTGVAIGEGVRDFEVRVNEVSLFPYSDEGEAITVGETFLRDVWPLRAVLRARVDFGQTPEQRGLRWYDHSMFFPPRYRATATLPFAFVASHNHFAIDRGRKVFNRSAPVVKLKEPVRELELHGLLAPLASSCAAFWLRETGYLKGGGEEPWADRMEYTVARLLEFPVPGEVPVDLAHAIDRTVQARARLTPASVVASTSIAGLADASQEWQHLGRVLVALQEELDWRMYVAYGLATADLAPIQPEVVPIAPNERVFAVRLAQSLASGETTTVWFDRHGLTPVTEFPSVWPAWYRDLAERRVAAIESNPSLRLLEQPEHKRRWAGGSWKGLLADAVRTHLLDRLETPELWSDGAGRPLVKSVSQVADALRADARVRELLTLHSGSSDFDLTTEIGKLLAAEAVPTFAPLRYKPAGVEKFRAWERTWDLQRAEDRGETVDVPVPPKYGPTDFLKPSYWTARGKLDVPKERFLCFPGTRLPDDPTELYGWAGWDHPERGQAIARLANEVSRAGAVDDQVIPLIGALVELQPWLDQWYNDLDARSGVSPATAISGATTALLGRLGIGADTVLAWRPTPATRGRKKA